MVLAMNPTVLAFFSKLFLFKDVYNLQKYYNYNKPATNLSF